GVGQEPGTATANDGDADGLVLGLGGWTSHFGLALSAGLEQANVQRTVQGFTSVPPDTGTQMIVTPYSARRSSSATAAQLSAQWTIARVTLETSGGLTAGLHTAPSRWGQAMASYPLTRQFAVFALAGSPAPRWYTVDPSRDHHAALGLRFT